MAQEVIKLQIDPICLKTWFSFKLERGWFSSLFSCSLVEGRGISVGSSSGGCDDGQRVRWFSTTVTNESQTGSFEGTEKGGSGEQKVAATGMKPTDILLKRIEPEKHFFF